MINFSIKELNAFAVIGQEVELTNYQKKNIQISTQFWRKFNSSLKKAYLSQSGNWVKYAFMERRNGKLYYFCSIPQRTITPEGFLYKEIPSYKYLVVEHIGAMDKIYETYGKIYEEIIPSTSYIPIKDIILHFEKYDYRFMFKFGIGGANMPTRTPIPVSRAMRQISANLDLARRQQRIPVALLAERAGLSMPTVTKMLRTGNGSFENFLRIARLLGLLDGVQQATDPLNTDIGKLRADEDTPKRIR